MTQRSQREFFLTLCLVSLAQLMPALSSAQNFNSQKESHEASQNHSLGVSQNSSTQSSELNIEHSTSHYDSIISDWQSKRMTQSLDKFVADYVTLDTTTYLSALSPLTDSQYIERLNGVVSPIHLPYNDIIRKHIVAYTTTHKSETRRMLGNSLYYFPIIEEEFAKQGLPLELKFLTVIESGLQPTAGSSSGAMGLWQFTLATGRNYGLEISSMVDERRDPKKSTQAAARYLKDLYKIYNDWTLAIASYNYGPGNVNKAIKRAGSGAKTYWDIYPYLPKVTRDYIPAFVGLTYAYHYYKEHNITPYAPPIPLSTDTMTIKRNLDLKQVALGLNIPLELLRDLNPQYKQDLIPAAVKEYPLVLPQREISRFVDYQNSIYALDSLYISSDLLTSVTAVANKTAASSSSVKSTSVTYKVKSGDNLGAIAKKYGIKVDELTKWNNITTKTTLKIGQVLKVAP